MKNTVEIKVGDYIYIYKPLNTDYRKNPKEEIKISKTKCIVNKIEKLYFGMRLQLVLHNTHAHYSYVSCDKINATLKDYKWGDSYHSTIENDKFFSDVFFKEKRDKLVLYYWHQENLDIEKDKKANLYNIKKDIQNTGIESIIGATKINFNRYSNNKKTKTFDTIRATISLVGFSVRNYTKKEIVNFLVPYKKEIVEYVMDKIRSSKKFQNYNIPIGFIKVYKITVTNDMCLVLDFELKEA